MRIGLVTCRELPEPDHDEALVLTACPIAEMAAWDDPSVDWHAYSTVVLRSCWNSHIDPDSFLDWLSRAEGATRVLNPPSLVRWNFDKHYLADLKAWGLPTVPTVFVARDEPVGLKEAAGQLDSEKVVVKPTVSAASWKTKVFSRNEFVEGDGFLADVLSDRDAMVQPYLPAAARDGERSVVWIDGQVTHAVVKRPRFEGQDESVSDGVPATAEEVAMTDMIVGRLSERPFYARLDLIPDDTGEWLVSELELIEPSLFLKQHPPALTVFAKALTRLG